MEHGDRSRRSSRILWGVLLMALGGALLLDRAGVLGVPALWELWPGILVVIGVNHLFCRRPGSGATMMLMGLAFFSAEFGWMGLTWATFWPLLLVAVGVGIVIRAFSREDDRREGRRDRDAGRDGAPAERTEACHD